MLQMFLLNKCSYFFKLYHLIEVSERKLAKYHKISPNKTVIRI